MAKRKKQSKQERSLKAKVYYIKKKNDLIKKESEKIDDNKFYSINSKKVKEGFKGHEFKQSKKIKGSTLKNILKNKIVQNNAISNKALKTIKNKFKKNLLKTKPKSQSNKKGFRKSGEYLAWEGNLAIAWIEQISGKNFTPEFIDLINETTNEMDSTQVFQMTYDKKENVFDCYIINAD